MYLIKSIENDFEEVPVKGKNQKEKPVYYKDLVRQTVTEEKNKKRTPREVHEEEQEDLKNAFKMAANGVEEDDLLKVRKKSKKQIEDENTEFNRFLEEEKKKSKPEEVDLLQRFWGDEEQLDDADKFLRKYILTKGYSFFCLENREFTKKIDGLIRMRTNIMVLMMLMKKMIEEKMKWIIMKLNITLDMKNLVQIKF